MEKQLKFLSILDKYSQLFYFYYLSFYHHHYFIYFCFNFKIINKIPLKKSFKFIFLSKILTKNRTEKERLNYLKI